MKRYARKWLAERRAIVESYKKKCNAVYMDHLHKWVILSSDGKCTDLDFTKADHVGLVVNHAYYLGAVDMCAAMGIRASYL